MYYMPTWHVYLLCTSTVDYLKLGIFCSDKRLLGAAVTCHQHAFHKSKQQRVSSAPLDISPPPTHELYTKAHIQSFLLIIYTPVKEFF